MNRKRKDGFDYYVDRYQNEINDEIYDYEPYYDNNFGKRNRYDAYGHNTNEQFYNNRSNKYNTRTSTHTFNNRNMPLNGTMEFTAVPGHNLNTNTRVLSDQTMMMGRTYDMNMNIVRKNEYLAKTIARNQMKSNNMLATRTHQLQQRVDNLGEAMNIMSNKLDSAMDYISNEVKQVKNSLDQTTTATLSFKNEYADERNEKENFISEIKSEIQSLIRNEFNDKINKYDEFIKKQNINMEENQNRAAFEQQLELIRNEYEAKINSIQQEVSEQNEQIDIQREKEEISKEFEKKLEEQLEKIKEENLKQLENSENRIKELEKTLESSQNQYIIQREKEEEQIKKIKEENLKQLENSENRIKELEKIVEETKKANDLPRVEKQPIDEYINPIKMTPNVDKTIVIPNNISPNQEQKSNKKKKIIIWSIVAVILVLLIVGGIVAFMLLKDSFVF